MFQASLELGVKEVGWVGSDVDTSDTAGSAGPKELNEVEWRFMWMLSCSKFSPGVFSSVGKNKDRIPSLHLLSLHTNALADFCVLFCAWYIKLGLFLGILLDWSQHTKEVMSHNSFLKWLHAEFPFTFSWLIFGILIHFLASQDKLGVLGNKKQHLWFKKIQK